MAAVQYLDGDGELWRLEERIRFGREGNCICTTAAVMVRRADRVDGVIISAPADWQNEIEMARLVFEAKQQRCEEEDE